MSEMIAVDARLANNSGIGVYIRNMLAMLLDVRPNWRIQIIGAPDELRDELEAHRNAVFTRAGSKFYSVSEQFETPIRTHSDADAFWSPHYNAALLTNKPLLVTIHDLNHLALPDLVAGWHRRVYARTMFNSIRRRANGLLFVSEFSHSEFRRLVGQPRSPVWITPNAVAPHWRRGQRQTRTSRPYVVTVGNVKPHKNLQGLLTAFEQVSAESDLDLVIIGKNEGFLHGLDLSHAIERFGGRVRMTGKISDRELKAIVENAEALVAPSFYEGFGIPPLEAMAVGCPTVVARSSAFPEVCGDASEYVDPADPADIARGILAVVRDQRRADGLRKRGRERVRRYSWRRSAEIVAGALESIVGRRAPGDADADLHSREARRARTGMYVPG